MAVFSSTSPLHNQLIVLIGGSGFFGRHLAQALLAQGARLRIACRHPERAYELKAVADLGQLSFVCCDVTRPDSVVAALVGADAVVNLVGAFTGDLDAVQGRGAGQIAALAKKAKARAFVHISAIGADAESPVAYARTKAAGEAAVLKAFRTATVLRPSLLFGADDSFTSLFAGLIAALPVLPVFGPQAQLQPLLVDDAALAVAAALANSGAHGGKTYELGGPEIVTMLELHQRLADAQGRKPLLVPLPDVVSAAFATLTGWLPGAPITRAQWCLLRAGSVVAQGANGIAALDITPRPLSLFLDRWMVRFREHGRFGTATA